MKPIPDSFRSRIKLSENSRQTISAGFALLLLILVFMASIASGQSLTWTGSFQQGVAPTGEQCQNWTTFLNQLSGKSFASVNISGSFDPIGRTITDPAAATQLASLLSSQTPGTVVSDGHTWTVTKCQLGACGTMSVALSVDGNQAECDCSDKYALRPHSANEDWGGINSPSGGSCRAESQTIKLIFQSGVSIVPLGSTTLCEGGSVTLTAKSDNCNGTLKYLWSTGEQSPSIEVRSAGSYTVTVSDDSGCSGTSSAVTVSNSDISVTATASGTFCDTPIKLTAVGVSSATAPPATVNKFCLFDSDQGGRGNCDFSAANVCLEGLDEIVSPSSYDATASVANAGELRYKLYYTSYIPVDFTFRLNGQVIGTFTENDPTGACEEIGGLRAPRVFSFFEHQFKQYWLDGTNTISVDVSGGNYFYLAGLSAEVITSSQSYSWTPTTGLDVANIANPMASPAETTLYTVTYTDAIGCKATSSVEVQVKCEEPPVALCKARDIILTDNCVVNLTASDFDGGSYSPSRLPLSYSISPAGPFSVGITVVTLTVTDTNNKSATCSTTVTVTDATLPTISVPANVSVPSAPGSCSATVSLAVPQVADNCGVKQVMNDHPDNIFPVGTTTVRWTVTDINGNQQTATQLVTVNNASPVINSVIASSTSVLVGSAVILTTTYTDDNASTATVDWGDGSLPEIINSPLAVFEVTHAYLNTGSYAVTVTVKDLCGATTTYPYGSIGIFDRGAGAVKGGGWFGSPPGSANRPEHAGGGKVNFNFSAKYNLYSDVPVGDAMFSLKSEDMKFKGSEFEMLLISGQNATLKGAGSLNGKPGYGVLVTMVDDDTKNKSSSPKKSDRIRVKIWDPAGVVIYDSQRGEAEGAVASTNLGGGSIEIQTTTTTTPIFQNAVEETVASSFGNEATSVYPNPFVDYITVQYNSRSNEDVVFRLMDLAGRVIANGAYPVSADGSYSLDIPEHLNKGSYILSIKQGKRVEFMNMVKK